MKKAVLIIFAIFALTGMSYADTSYTPDSFKKAQENGEKILLHFHADWCPTCSIQNKSLASLGKSGSLKGIHIFKVNYDKEDALKKELHVTAQATFISFYGTVETGRATGLTSEKDIKEFLDKNLISLTLKDQLRLLSASFANMIPPEKKKVMDEATEKLRISKLTDNALKVGQKAPQFSLKNSYGKMVSLKNLLKEGPVILTFYRGSWCPFCSAQLIAYQKHLSSFQKRGARLVAVTPEKPDLTSITHEKKKLGFDILTDNGNELAAKFGLVFGVPPELKEIYKEFGVDLEKTQGNPDWNLPVPATYVISRSGKIIYAFTDVDYTHRADPQDILNALAGIK
ncbi:Peroxiredoxin [Trichlorobacter thiogenes]|uniref:thioredoxin-dependent peroxiredoxin n=1 Tax=Trichlorobacter thiogenes TaxID=115783 RepID=A0A1T4S5I0_9BACT|nr:redoxin domain-containing protein [Trichlorobacter thiogenes]SKA23407.1 Peroxiredoxin [Trichlorobacter thiogenes]